MRMVLGLSLTATSAVWALVDTKDGAILADEVVALESVNEIARATARSVQSFALQSERDIDGIRMTWTDDARNQGIRLRSKLRLFGFDTIEQISEDDAREGRNRTARHIAPHLTLAYGAARAHADDDGNGLLRRLTARVPVGRASFSRVPMPIAIAASIATVCAVAALGVFTAMGGPSPQPVETTNAEVVPVTDPSAAVVPAPAPQPPAARVAAPAPAPAALAAREPAPPVADPQAVTPQIAAAPQYGTAPESAVTPEPAQSAAVSTEPVVTEPDATGSVTTGPLPAETPPATALVGQPHLTDDAPQSGPVPAPAQAVQAPVIVPAPPPNPFDILAALP